MKINSEKNRLLWLRHKNVQWSWAGAHEQNELDNEQTTTKSWSGFYPLYTSQCHKWIIFSNGRLVLKCLRLRQNNCSGSVARPFLFFLFDYNGSIQFFFVNATNSLFTFLSNVLHLKGFFRSSSADYIYCPQISNLSLRTNHNGLFYKLTTRCALHINKRRIV